VLCRGVVSKQEFAEAFLDLVGTVDDTAVDIPEVRMRTTMRTLFCSVF